MFKILQCVWLAVVTVAIFSGHFDFAAVGMLFVIWLTLEINHDK